MKKFKVWKFKAPKTTTFKLNANLGQGKLFKACKPKIFKARLNGKIFGG